MIQLEDLLRTSQAHIERLHEQAEQMRKMRGDTPPRLRQRIARVLYRWAEDLDPRQGERMHRPIG